MSIVYTDEQGWLDGQTGKQRQTDRRMDRQMYLTCYTIQLMHYSHFKTLDFKC